MPLVKEVRDAVDRIEHEPARVVLPAAVLVHEVELRRVAERLAAKLVAREARGLRVVVGPDAAEHEHWHRGQEEGLHRGSRRTDKVR